MYITDDFVSDSFVLTTKEEEKIKRRADFLKISHSLTLACCCVVVFLSVRKHIYTHIHLARKGNEDTHIYTYIYLRVSRLRVITARAVA